MLTQRRCRSWGLGALIIDRKGHTRLLVLADLRMGHGSEELSRLDVRILLKIGWGING
jgi:hypothetical protein